MTALADLRAFIEDRQDTVDGEDRPKPNDWMRAMLLLDALVLEIGRLQGHHAADSAEIGRLTCALSKGADFQLATRTAETLDAERYRYLRTAAGQYAGDECGPMVCSGCGDNFEYLRGEEVDAEVDEAIAAWKAAGCPLPKEAA